MNIFPEELQTKNGKVIFKTFSVCPVCLKRIPAERVQYGDYVFLEKSCPEHGKTKTILWRGNPDYISWMRPKIHNPPKRPAVMAKNGCPLDCGICSSHRQGTCCVLLEVTQRCNLGCPVCFASSSIDQKSDPDLNTIQTWYQKLLDFGGPFNIQLSGGEPSLRDDLAEIIHIGKSMGFTYFQINTNGLRIASEPDYLKKLVDAGLDVVYLQFDGTNDHIYQKLRGRKVFEQKLRVIEICESLQVGVVLVPTIVPGVNSDDLGNIIRLAIDHYPTVRSIHFQPISYMGRYPEPPGNESRITLPELFQGMEEQTHGLVHASDFQPKGSENSYCSFHASYIIMEDGSLRPLKQKTASACCSQPGNDRENLQRSKEFVAKNWTLKKSLSTNSIPTNLSMGGWDAVLERAKTHLFSISGMAFQDAWNLDTELLQECCIVIMSPEGRMIPFCAFNLTNSEGKTLYR